MGTIYRGEHPNPSFEKVDPDLGPSARKLLEDMNALTDLKTTLASEEQAMNNQVNQCQRASRIMVDRQFQAFKAKGHENPEQVGLFNVQVRNIEVWLEGKINDVSARYKSLEAKFKSVSEDIHDKFDNLVAQAFKLRQAAAFAPDAELLAESQEPDLDASLLKELEGLCLDTDDKPSEAKHMNTEHVETTAPREPEPNVETQLVPAPHEPEPNVETSVPAPCEPEPDSKKNGETSVPGEAEPNSLDVETPFPGEAEPGKNDAEAPVPCEPKPSNMDVDTPVTSEHVEAPVPGESEPKKLDLPGKELGSGSLGVKCVKQETDTPAKGDSGKPAGESMQNDGQPMEGKPPFQSALEYAATLEDGPIKSALLSLCESQMVKDWKVHVLYVIHVKKLC